MTGLDFLDRLTDGCSAAGAGFYFEEGGCWGMALALHDALARIGHEPEYLVCQRNRHAMIEAGGRIYDHTGEASWNGPAVRVSRDELMVRARLAGHDDDGVLSDADAASEIIGNARAMWLRDRQIAEPGSAKE